MAPHPAWSWVLFGVGIFGLLISGQWRPWGWLVVAFPIQIIYFLYGLKTHQRGFCASSVVFALAACLNFWRAVSP